MQSRPDWTSSDLEPDSHGPYTWGGVEGGALLGLLLPHSPRAKMTNQTRVQLGIAMMVPTGCLQSTGQPVAPCHLPQTSPWPTASSGFMWPWVPDPEAWAGRVLDSSPEPHAPEGCVGWGGGVSHPDLK